MLMWLHPVISAVALFGVLACVLVWSSRPSKQVEPTPALPPPAWATAMLPQAALEPVEEPLTHEAAWRARETLRRLDPERAARLDEILPLEEPPRPEPEPVEWARTLNTAADRLHLEHDHPLRARMAEVVDEMDALIGDVYFVVGDTFYLSSQQAAEYQRLTREAEALKAALEAERERKRKADALSELEERKGHAVRSLADLRVLVKDIERQCARTGEAPDLHNALDRVREAISHNQRIISDCDWGRRALLADGGPARRADHR